MKALFTILPLAILTACGGNSSTPDKDVLMHNDFDVLAGWTPDGTLSKEKAHSGKYSLRVDSGHEYSINYLASLGELSNTRIRGVKLEGWIYMTDQNATASIALFLKDTYEKKDVFSSYTAFPQSGEYGKWVKIDKEIIFPTDVNYSTQILIYLWRGNASSPAYLDDLQLSALR